jgi:TonB family protein
MVGHDNKIMVLTALALWATGANAADAPAAYAKTVLTAVSSKVEYPKMARMRHQEGVVTVVMTIDANGAPTASVEKSSGVQSLDDAAVAAVGAAAPFPAPPEAGVTVRGNIRFAEQ